MSKFGSIILSKDSDNKNVEKVSEKINQLIGLHNFKREMAEIIKLARYYSEEGESLSEKFNYHFLFVEKNSAGQNISAKLLTELFYALRIISKNEFYEYDVRQFIGNDIYQTADKTHKIFDKAKGSVLFIKDFDFVFSDKSLNQSIISEFANNLSQRFQIDVSKTFVIAETSLNFPDNITGAYHYLGNFFSKTITFDDYTPDELLEIFFLMVKDKKLNLSENGAELLRKFFFYVYRNKEKYPPNTLLLKNIFDIVQRKHLLRIADIPRDRRNDELNRTINEEDITDIIKLEKSKEVSSSGDYTSSIRKHLDELDMLSGLTEVKQTIIRIINSEKVAAMRKERGLNVLPRNLHGLFIRTSGTGKTTIAKIYAKILSDLGLINYTAPIELDRLTIKNYFPKENRLSAEFLLNEFEEKVIVLNNAGQLISNEEIFIKDFFDTTLSLLNKASDKFLLIISETQTEIIKILNTYLELKNFFTNTFHFRNYNPREMLELLYYTLLSNMAINSMKARGNFFWIY